MKDFKTFLAANCRLGVAESIEEIRKRIIANLGTTAIVIPPRVGKSSLARAASIEFVETKLIGGAVILVPWVFLRTQMNDPVKVAQMAEYHGMDHAPLSVPLIRCDSPEKGVIGSFKEPPIPHWITLTMGMAYQPATRAALVDISLQFRRNGQRLLVFIDEGHMTSSGPDGWGKLASELKNAGAHLVLLTGTPERSDNLSPFGFGMKEREESRRTGERVRKPGTNDEGKPCIDEFVGEKVIYDLVADYEVSLRAAFDAHILTKIQARPFKFKINGEDSKEVSDDMARRGLAEALRDNETITAGVAIVLEELSLFWKSVPDAKIAAIVFVGNDRAGDDGGADYDCRNVRNVIRREWKKYLPREPDVRTATLSDDGGAKARKTIENFCNGVGDIIIVKQMGGVGLDLGRLKVKLDLSTVMAYSNRKQRELRIATPYEGVDHGTSIFPATGPSIEMWHKIITENGGQYVHENLEFVKHIEIQGGSDPQRPLVISDPERDGSIDMDLRMVENSMDMQVDEIIGKWPSLGFKHTRREIADMIEGGIFSQSREETRLQSNIPPKTHVLNKADEVDKATSALNEKCRVLANREARYEKNGDTDPWVQARISWMTRAKVHAGIACEIGACRDLAKLAAAESFLDKYIESDDYTP